MTTVGYGDVVPKTPEGRLAATLLMVLGIGLFSAVTATVTSFLLEHDRDPLDELARLGDLRDRGLVTDDESMPRGVSSAKPWLQAGHAK